MVMRAERKKQNIFTLQLLIGGANADMTKMKREK